MKITILQGSPHKNGSSNLLANEFIRGAKEAGHTVTVLDARIWICTHVSAVGTAA